MVEYKSNKKLSEMNKKEPKKSMAKKIMIWGAVGLVAIGLLSEGEQHVQVKRIDRNAKIQEVYRSFKNLDKESMLEYLPKEINALYEKYPNLDDLVFAESEETKTKEFIDDMYRLYKAYMVDEASEKADVDNVKVVQVDQIFLQSDRIIEQKDETEEGEVKTEKTIKETHKEQNKHITDVYLESLKQGNGAKLAKVIYEFLASEIGLKENALTSKEIYKNIEEKGFYYDVESNTFFTKEGKATLVPNSELEKTQGTEKNEIEDTGFEPGE